MALVKDYKPTTGEPLFAIEITFENPDAWEKWLMADQDFIKNYAILFRNCVFETHKYLIRVTPMSSGRLRAGWTGILNKYNQDYTQAFHDTSLIDRFIGNYDMLAIQQGMQESQFMDDVFDVTIINTVPYAEYVEFGTSKMEGQNFTNKARYKGEFIFKQAIEEWFKEMTIAQEITEPKPVGEVIA